MKVLYQFFFLLLATMLLASGPAALAQNSEIERVEPLHWWTDMQNPELQVMLYGENIGHLDPKIEYEGVEITRIQPVENDNYLFLYLHISDEAKPGTFDIVLGDDGEEQITESYELREREENSANREGFNSSDVMYLITPDRFANGNPENDELPEYEDKLDRDDDFGRHGGDIQGIIDHLDYIEEMGYTAIWLNPVLENAMEEASYHGYSTTDYYKVDPRFGSNELYKKLSEEAEKRGIKLIKDMIMNHSGSEHWWMDDPPSSDWVHYPDEYQQTNHRRTVLQDPYASETDTEVFTDGWFVRTMPDLNQDNPLLADYLIYNSLWWIEYAGLGGIRHDTQPYAGQEFMQEWSCRIMEEYPNFNIVGEEWSLDPLVVAKWQRGSNLPNNFGSCLPSLMDFPLNQSLMGALSSDENEGSGFVELYEMLANDYIYPDPENLIIFADNHDKDRFFRQIDEDLDLYKMGMTYLATMRGIPQIYYGTELLFTNEKQGDHGQIREDFPGGWEGDDRNGFTGEGLSEQEAEAQNFLSKLLNWRKENPVIHSGKLKHFAPQQNGLYVYFRYNEDKTVMVILNKGKEAEEVSPERYREITKDFTEGTDVITDETYDLVDFEVPARSALILELK